MSTTSSLPARNTAAVLEHRVHLAHLPTPLHAMDRLAGHLGRQRGSILVKRDDLTGLAGGGNKARKLEYLLRDAIDQGCDVVVTGGAEQSNHCRQTAAACAALGLRCVAVVLGERPERPSGNLILQDACGSELRFLGADPDLAGGIETACDQLRAEGAKPYLVPVGGSTPLGALGYTKAGIELREQDDSFDLVVLANGSSGTQAGLAAGLGGHERILGVNIGDSQQMAEVVERIAREAAELAGLPEPSGSCRIDESQAGTAGKPTPAVWEAIRVTARLEGIILDPVYTGKAMAGLIEACRSGAIRPDQKIVFLHTGGLPGLLAERYQAWRS